MILSSTLTAKLQKMDPTRQSTRPKTIIYNVMCSWLISRKAETNLIYVGDDNTTFDQADPNTSYSHSLWRLRPIDP